MPRSDTTIRQDPTVVSQDLYDGLQMKAILQHQEMKSSRNRADGPLLTYNKRRRSWWQHWLDDLCLLCDSRRGGTTTTSIAVERTTAGAVFWLAMNAGDLEEASVYLAGVLDLVKRGQETREDQDGSTAICEIYTRAIARSPQRVKNYAKRLENVLQRVCRKADLNDDWPEIVDAAWRVLEPRDEHLSMCIKAYNLAKTIRRRQSATLREIEQGRNDFYRVRHYVGRLSAWISAARSVVACGAQHSGILQEYCVKTVSPAMPGPQVPLGLGDDFVAILNRVMPNFRDQPILSEISATVGKVFGATALFKGERLELKPHAETIILDHFFTNNIQFANGDMYVGCSRPSCYCCKLYFDHHPAGASTGRFHGVLWIKWRLPRLLESVQGTVDHTTLKVLQKMSDQVRKDVVAALMPLKHHDFNMFDSTTGFSTSHIASQEFSR